MFEVRKQQSGQKVRSAFPDSGDCSVENLRTAAKKKVDLYVATEKQKHNQPQQPGPVRAHSKVGNASQDET